MAKKKVYPPPKPKVGSGNKKLDEAVKLFLSKKKK
jgi:hypothetical protein